MLTRVISGGQSGVDQAALRAAASLGIAIGGWCPPGRVAEDGLIPDSFPLTETPQERSPAAPGIPRSQRTEWNVRNSDGTLLLCPGAITQQDAGTRWTAKCAEHYAKPLLIADPAMLIEVPRVHHWIEARGIRTMNVAGPSESTSPGIGTAAEKFVTAVLRLDALYVAAP